MFDQRRVLVRARAIMRGQGILLATTVGLFADVPGSLGVKWTQACLIAWAECGGPRGVA